MATLTSVDFGGLFGYIDGTGGSLSPDIAPVGTTVGLFSGVDGANFRWNISGDAISALSGLTAMKVDGVDIPVTTAPSYDGSSLTTVIFGPLNFAVGTYSVEPVYAAAYAGPTYVGISTGAGNATSVPISFSSSGRTAGDRMFIAVMTANEAVPAVSGWTVVTPDSGTASRGTAGTAGGVRCTVLTRVSDGTETSVTIGDSGNIQYAAGIVVRGDSGADVDLGVSIGGSAAASTSGSFTGVTTDGDNQFILTFVATDRDASAASWSSQSNANLGNLTERFDNGTATNTGGGVAIYTGEKLVAGATGTTTATQAASAAYCWITLAVKNAASGPATHDTSGALTGQIGSVAGSAAHVAIHGASGALSGQLGGVAGSAARKREMATSGALTGQVGAVAGVAARSAGAVSHDASGSLAGQLGSVTGSSLRYRAFSASGALSGQLGSVSGSSARARAHGSSGVLVGPAAAISGSAARMRAFGSSGALAGQNGGITGAAERSTSVVSHDTSGSLTGQGSAVAGVAVRFRVMATSGALLGPGSAIAGSASIVGKGVYVGARSSILVGKRAVYVGAKSF